MAVRQSTPRQRENHPGQTGPTQTVLFYANYTKAGTRFASTEYSFIRISFSEGPFRTRRPHAGGRHGGL